MRADRPFKNTIRASAAVTAALAFAALAPAAHGVTLPLDVDVTTNPLPIGATLDVGAGALAPAVSVDQVQPSIRTKTMTHVLRRGHDCAADVQVGPSVQTPARATVVTSRRGSRSQRRSVAVPRRLLATKSVGACVRAS